LRSGVFYTGLGFEPIQMQHPGGVLLPPVQKLVASLQFAQGKLAIESLILCPQKAISGTDVALCPY